MEKIEILKAMAKHMGFHIITDEKGRRQDIEDLRNHFEDLRDHLIGATITGFRIEGDIKVFEFINPKQKHISGGIAKQALLIIGDIAIIIKEAS